MTSNQANPFFVFSDSHTHTRTSATGRKWTPFLPHLLEIRFQVKKKNHLNQKTLNILASFFYYFSVFFLGFFSDSADTASPSWGRNSPPMTLSMFPFIDSDWLKWRRLIYNSVFQCRVCPLCLGFYSSSICFTLPSTHSDVSTTPSGYDECNVSVFAWIPHSSNQQLSKTANRNN